MRTHRTAEFVDFRAQMDRLQSSGHCTRDVLPFDVKDAA